LTSNDRKMYSLNKVQTIFGSNFFGFQSTGNGNRLAIASNFWIYIVATIALSGATIILWFWWWRNTRARENLEEAKKLDDLESAQRADA